MNSFYSPEELRQLHLKSVGTNVLISRKCSIYGASDISIGNNVRIDDFCILSGDITIGNNVHISAYVALYGAMGIVFEDNTGISARATIYSAMDDFSGNFLVGPMHPEGNRNVTGGMVKVCRFAHIGAHSMIYPTITIPEGCVVGAMSLVNSNPEPWSIYAGIPARKLKPRSNNLIDML